MNFEWLRTEVYHPLTVHFPIVLLLLATVAVLLQFVSKNKGGWQKTIYISLFSGTAFIWFSVYTGDLADGIVSRELCDPTILKDHENFAYYTAYLYSAASLVLLLKNYYWRDSKFIQILLLLTTLIGASCMVYVGHLGASLVYEQAAGVFVPSPDCQGF